MINNNSNHLSKLALVKIQSYLPNYQDWQNYRLTCKLYFYSYEEDDLNKRMYNHKMIYPTLVNLQTISKIEIGNKLSFKNGKAYINDINSWISYITGFFFYDNRFKTVIELGRLCENMCNLTKKLSTNKEKYYYSIENLLHSFNLTFKGLHNLQQTYKNDLEFIIYSDNIIANFVRFTDCLKC